MSYTSIQTQIQNAPDLVTGLVPWVGTNGERSILLNLNDSIRNNGIIVVSDLSTITGTDTHLVFVVGKGLYAYNPNPIPSPAPTGYVVAAGGGYWYILARNGNEFRTTVDTTGGLTFTIPHNMNYDYPNVKAIKVSNKFLQPLDNVTYVDSNTLSITFPTGTANQQFIVIAQI